MSGAIHGSTVETAKRDHANRGRYRVRVDYEGRTHAIGMYDYLVDARAALDIARGQIARETFVPPTVLRSARKAEAAKAEAQSVTLREWSETWLATLEANPDRSPATIVSYRSILNRHILEDLGDVRLADLTTERVADHLRSLGRFRSSRHPDARVNGVAPNVAIVLRSMLNAAVKAGAGTLEAFDFPKAPKHRRVRPEDEHGDVALPEEVEAFADAMPDHLRIAVPLAAWCALRIGEVLGLQRRDLEHLDDPHKAVLHVRRQWNVKANALTPPKANSTRSIAIPAALLPELIRHLREHTPPQCTAPVLSNGRGARASPERSGPGLEECERGSRPTRIPLPQSAAHGLEQVCRAGSDPRRAAAPWRAHGCHRCASLSTRDRTARSCVDRAAQQGDSSRV